MSQSSFQMPLTKDTNDSHHDFLMSVWSTFLASFPHFLYKLVWRIPITWFSFSLTILEVLSAVANQNKMTFPRLL